MPKLNYDRRHFLARTAVTPLWVLALPAAVQNFFTVSEQTKLRPEPTTAMASITMAKTALDIMTGFSGNPANGMAALMRYQIGLLHEMIGQLTDIQTRLVDVQNSIAQLPEQIRQIMAEQFLNQTIFRIRAASSRYVNNVMQPSRTNPALLNSELVRNDIQNIIQTLDQEAETLRVIDQGKGPEACMIAPLALSISMAGRTNLGTPREILISQLKMYQNWFDDMLSEKNGSIIWSQRKAIAEHDKAINDLRNNPLAQRMGINNFKLDGGNQISTEECDPGILFTKDYDCKILAGSPCDKYDGYYPHENILKDFFSGIYRRMAKISAVSNAALGVNLLEYQIGEPFIATREEPATMRAYKPVNGKYYAFLRVDREKKLSSATIKKLAESNNSPNRFNSQFRLELEKQLAIANLQRAHIGFCAQATIVAHNTQKRIFEYLNTI